MRNKNNYKSLYIVCALSSLLVACNGGSDSGSSNTQSGINNNLRPNTDGTTGSTCDGLPTWNASSVYNGGDRVVADGKEYKANWWTQGENPLTKSGKVNSGQQPWLFLNSCGDAPIPPVPSPSPSPTPTSSPAPVPTPTSTPEPQPPVPDNYKVYPDGRGSYTGGTIVKGSDGKLYQCQSNVVAPWCNSTAEWAYAPASGTAWSSAWQLVDNPGPAPSPTPPAPQPTEEPVPPAPSPAGKHLVVGYVDKSSTGAFASIKNEAFKQYDIIVVGFADCNPASCNTPSKLMIDTAAHVAANAKPGAQLLLSVGGQNDSQPFSPNASNPSQMPAFADKLVSYMNQINSNITSGPKLTGVDLDIEVWNSGENITALAKALKLKGSIVAVAPILATVGGSQVSSKNPTTLSLTAGGMQYSDYSGALASGNVDYLFVQAYNGGDAEVISIDNKTMLTPDFHDRAAEAMHNLVKDSCFPMNGNKYANGAMVCIPKSANTKIMIGTVANYSAGGAWENGIEYRNHMWKYMEKSAAGNKAILNAFNASVQKAKSYQYYNGVMVWSIGNDYFPSAWSNDTWDPVGAFTNNIVNLGFTE